MRLIGVILFLNGLLYAQTIHQLIDTSLTNHPSLQMIAYRLSSMPTQIQKSQKFSNPDLSMTINDIQFDDPTNRSLEPMQYSAINIKQKFPWFGKLDARKNVVEAKRDLILDSYDEAKVSLANQIRTTAYTIKELEARIKIMGHYQTIIEQNVALYTAYTSTQSQSHTNSISAGLMLSKTKIKTKRYQARLKSQRAKLKYLVQKNISTVSDRLAISSPASLQSYLLKMHNNPTYRMKLSQTHLADANKVVDDLSITPDPYVKVGYFNRESYPDYASVSVGISLPLYGTEKDNIEIARKEVLARQSEALDYKYSLESQITMMYARLVEAYEIYHIIKKQSLPQLEHMFALTQSRIQNGSDLFRYNTLLEQKLTLEEELVSIEAEYLRTQANLKSLIGEL